MKARSGCWRVLALVLGALVLVGGAWAQSPSPAPPPAAGGGASPRPLPPAELFFGEPQFDAARLSPSGRWIAVKTNAGGAARQSLVVIDVSTGQVANGVVRFGNVDVDDFWWVGDDRLLLDVSNNRLAAAHQSASPGLWSVRRDGSDLRQLIHTEAVDTGQQTGTRIVTRLLDASHRLLFVPQGGGDEVIVGRDEWHVGEWQGVRPMWLNIANGQVRSMPEGARGLATRWFFGPDGTARAYLTRRDGRTAVFWRGAEGWTQLLEAPLFDAPWTPRAVDAEGRLLVLVNTGAAGESRLHRFDFATGRPEAEPIVSTPGFDFVGGPLSEREGSRILGVWVETDAETTVWFDKRLAALQEEADRRFPGLINRLSCSRCGEPDMTVLVFSFAAQHPGLYSVFTQADGRWRTLLQRRPRIVPAQMATMAFERFQARDGRSIPVWVTRPSPQVAPRDKPLPAVVLVHGGPWVRGGWWRWNPEAQFLASRGYVVIEPEFRGSTGFGEAHFRAGWKQWGQAMQDDIADATLWATRAGWIDPGRVCIAGASYGGYSTLMGLIRHGDLYRCGVAWVAVTDPTLLFRWTSTSDISDAARRYSYPQLLGDPVSDREMLERNSPVLRAGEIQRPLLLAMGGIDPRVELVHATRFRSAMSSAGRTLEYVVYRDEGHGWTKLDNQLDFYGRMERFLAEHLK